MLSSQGKPARRRSVYGHNTGTTLEDVYVCPDHCVAEVSYILIANAGSSTNTVDVNWYVSADAYTSHFLNDKSLNAGDYHEFSEVDLILAAGDKIQVQPGSAGHIDSIVTVTETFLPIQ